MILGDGAIFYIYIMSAQQYLWLYLFIERIVVLLLLLLSYYY